MLEIGRQFERTSTSLLGFFSAKIGEGASICFQRVKMRKDPVHDLAADANTISFTSVGCITVKTATGC
jgi:hypothetical protein